jgi:hypothetical protein
VNPSPSWANYTTHGSANAACHLHWTTMTTRDTKG